LAARFSFAKLAAGCLLDELKNDITRETPARPVRESGPRLTGLTQLFSLTGRASSRALIPA